eukprot:4521536-Ditylum_brightwellii.AAC.1
MLAWQFNEYGMPTITPEAELPLNTEQVHQNGIPTIIKWVSEITVLKLLGAYSALDQSDTGTQNFILTDTRPLPYLEGKWINSIYGDLQHIQDIATIDGHCLYPAMRAAQPILLQHQTNQ